MKLHYALTSLIVVVTSVAMARAEDEYFCALGSVSGRSNSSVKAVFFKTSGDLASIIDTDKLTVRTITKGKRFDDKVSSLASGQRSSEVWGPFRIDKELFDRAINAPGELPDATHLIALHNVEPWIVPPGKAPDLVHERYKLAVSRIIQQADR